MSSPFIDGAQVNAERLAAAVIGFIGAQVAAGWASIIDAVFRLLQSPFVGLTNLLESLASGLVSGFTVLVETAYLGFRGFVVGAGPLSFPLAVGIVLAIAGIAVYGGDLVG